jgi:hemerythrin
VSIRDEPVMFEWTPEYSAGIEEIDGDHRRLFALAESMHRAMLAQEGRQILEALLADLLKYTEYHFAHEEQLMLRSSYPAIAEHRRQHHHLRRQAAALQRRAAQGEATMSIEVAQFLIGWLKQHTLSSDRRMGLHWKAVGLPIT